MADAEIQRSNVAMHAMYYFSADARGPRARAIIEEFVQKFGENATSIERHDIDDVLKHPPADPSYRRKAEDDNLWVHMVVPFDPELHERGLRWAAQYPEVKVSDNFNREYTSEDCKSAPLCTLSFPDCYIYPEEYSWRPCPGCRGDRLEATGKVADRIELKKGIGESHGQFFLGKSMAKEITKPRLKGFKVVPWTKNNHYSLVEPTCTLQSVLIEGVNVLGLDATTCFGCGRPGRRYLVGPDIVDEGSYDGEDIARIRSAMCQVPQTWMDGYAFSQRAAQFFVTYLRVAKYWQPVFFRSSDLPAVP